MNTDDPKLTAFALNELDESEQSAIAREVAQSVEAQRVVNETRELARQLKIEFTAQLNVKTTPARNLSDIHDDPWFWSIGRPLAIAVAITLFAIFGAIIIGKYSRTDSTRSVPGDYIVEGEQISPHQPVELPSVDKIPNPLPADSIRRVERIVIGEINNDPRFQNAELRVIETINDVYRLERLKQRLSTPVISKKTYRGSDLHNYGLVFLDHDGRVIASARFYRIGDSQFVLQPVKNAHEDSGRYFMNGGAELPGNWREGVDYNQYVIQFPDWIESIGYAPGV